MKNRYTSFNSSQWISTKHSAWALISLLSLVGCSGEAADPQEEVGEVSQAMLSCFPCCPSHEDRESGLTEQLERGLADQRLEQTSKAESNFQDEQRGKGAIPLHVGSRGGQVDMEQQTIEQSAGVEEQAPAGLTMLHEVASMGNVERVQQLLEQGAQVNAQAQGGLTPLHAAASAGHVEAVRLLLHKGADISAQNNYGETPLHVAAQNSQVEVVQLLLDKGADIHAQTKDGETPLHWAVKGGHLKVVALLLERGADYTYLLEHENEQIRQLAQQWQALEQERLKVLQPYVHVHSRPLQVPPDVIGVIGEFFLRDHVDSEVWEEMETLLESSEKGSYWRYKDEHNHVRMDRVGFIRSALEAEGHLERGRRLDECLVELLEQDSQGLNRVIQSYLEEMHSVSQE